MMTIDEYQTQAVTTAVYDSRVAILYPALGLAGEAGEVCNKVKKVFRDDGGVLTDEKRQQIKGELGDVMWYLAGTARDCGISLQEAAEENLAKLADRKARGVLQGSGDNR
jgi:NTP pyrophosphatase (non-canonical NTP hydrolase)